MELNFQVHIYSFCSEVFINIDALKKKIREAGYMKYESLKLLRVLCIRLT